MTLSKEKAEELRKKKQPVIGWVEGDDGWLLAPNDFAQHTVFPRPVFSRLAERTRARWDLFDYVGTIIRQRRRRK